MELLFPITLLLLGLFLLVFAIVIISFQITDIAITRFKDAPYVPSARERVATMLELAELRGGERVVDLGAGNGRIVFAAAAQGAFARGVEANPFLVRYAGWRASRNGFGERANMVRGDFWHHSVADADVVFLYLFPRTMARLEEKLLQELKPGARVVSNTFPFPSWKPIRTKNSVFLYQKV